MSRPNQVRGAADIVVALSAEFATIPIVFGLLTVKTISGESRGQIDYHPEPPRLLPPCSPERDGLYIRCALY